MILDDKLDLTMVPWPKSILLCDRALEKMAAGKRLVLVTEDPDVADSIRMMVNNKGVFSSTETHDNGRWTFVVGRRRRSGGGMS
jgi:TusA-related sulfurtransferase